MLAETLRLQVNITRRICQRAMPPICSNIWNGQLQTYRNAGHSHWQNIRHIKGAKDMEKQKQTNMLLLKLRIAVKEGGGNCDPKLNSKIVNIFEEGQSKGIPKNTLTEYLKKLEDKSNFKVHTIEAKGPGQSLFMFEVFTNKPNISEGAIQGIFKRNQGRVGRKGFASYGFDNKGYITIDATEELTLDRMTDIAIECEAEDVEEINEDNQLQFQLSFPAEDLYKVKGNLEKAGVTLKKMCTIWKPKKYVSLTEEENSLIEKIFTKLQSVEDIEDVYHNLEALDP